MSPQIQKSEKKKYNLDLQFFYRLWDVSCKKNMQCVCSLCLAQPQAPFIKRQANAQKG